MMQYFKKIFGDPLSFQKDLLLILIGIILTSLITVIFSSFGYLLTKSLFLSLYILFVVFLLVGLSVSYLFMRKTNRLVWKIIIGILLVITVFSLSYILFFYGYTDKWQAIHYPAFVFLISLSFYIAALLRLEGKYGIKTAFNLIHFWGYIYLREYLQCTFNISNKSKRIEILPREIVEYWNKQKENNASLFDQRFRNSKEFEFFVGTPSKIRLRMDHILLKLIKNAQILIKNLDAYQIEEGIPVDLYSSYYMSIKLANELSNDSNNLLWFTNMKEARIYGKSLSVSYHYKNIYYIIWKKPKIDTRRIHLFYDKSLLKSIDDFKENCQYLFTNLVLEKIHGIKSKILFIKDGKFLEDITKVKSNGLKRIGEIFLLDYALNFKYLNKIDDGYEAFSPNNRNILCADFTAEDPNYAKLEKYEDEKVYILKNPIIFELFRTHFLSLWNLNDYKEYIGQESLRNHELANFATYLKSNSNVEICNFFEFWDEIYHLPEIRNVKLFIKSAFEDRLVDKLFYGSEPQENSFFNTNKITKDSFTQEIERLTEIYRSPEAFENFPISIGENKIPIKEILNKFLNGE